MNEIEKFRQEVEQNILGLSQDRLFLSLSQIWLRDSARHKWSYNFTWLGRPAIQLPNDAWAMQEIIWDVKPDLIIECGIAHGGSLICYASMLALLDMAEAVENNGVADPAKTSRKVLGIDVDIRAHNREAIESHPMHPWIQMIEGSSIDPEVVNQVRTISKGFKRVLVSLDSNHTHDHVLGELEAYAQLVSKGSYCVVFDTVLGICQLNSALVGHGRLEIVRRLRHWRTLELIPNSRSTKASNINYLSQ